MCLFFSLFIFIIIIVIVIVITSLLSSSSLSSLSSIFFFLSLCPPYNFYLINYPNKIFREGSFVKRERKKEREKERKKVRKKERERENERERERVIIRNDCDTNQSSIVCRFFSLIISRNTVAIYKYKYI